MLWLITLLIIGIVTGSFMGTLTEGRGLETRANIVIAVLGSFIGGGLFAIFGESVFGPGPVYLASLLMAVVGAVVLPVLAGFMKNLPLGT